MYLAGLFQDVLSCHAATTRGLHTCADVHPDVTIVRSGGDNLASYFGADPLRFGCRDSLVNHHRVVHESTVAPTSGSFELVGDINYE